MSVTEVVIRLLWSLGGFVLGYLVGRAGREARQGRRPWDAWRLVRDNVLGIVLVLIAVTGLVYYAQTVNCQQEFNERFRQAVNTVLSASLQQSKAQQELLLTITSTEDPVVEQRIIRQYIEATQRLNELRSRNIIPVESGCG